MIFIIALSHFTSLAVLLQTANLICNNNYNDLENEIFYKECNLMVQKLPYNIAKCLVELCYGSIIFLSYNEIQGSKLHFRHFLYKLLTGYGVDNDFMKVPTL